MSRASEVEQMYLDKGLSEKFCPVPFTTLIINPNGTVNVCRQKGSDYVVGDLKKQTIEQIWNSEFIQSWRAEFLSGRPVICAKEMKHMGCHLSPENADLLDEAQLEVIVQTPIIKLGANLNGECNLRCQMCNIWKMPSGLYDQNDFWDWAPTNLLPYLKEIDLYAGEPMIQKDTFKLMDMMAVINPDCLWTITTNLNWDFGPKVKSAFNKLKFKNIIASYDSLDPHIYSQIRKGGDHSLATQTLETLVEYSKNCENPFDIVINFLIQRENWREIEQQIDFADKLGARSFRSYVYEPLKFSLSSLPEREKLEIIDEMLKIFSVATIERSMKVIRPIIDSLGVGERKKVLLKLSDLRCL